MNEEVQPQEVQPQEVRVVRTCDKSIAGMVCGILSILTSEVFIPGIVLGILGIVFGRKARKEIQKSDGYLRGEGIAITGFVCGIVGLVLSVVVGLILAAIIGFGIFVCSFGKSCQPFNF